MDALSGILALLGLVGTAALAIWFRCRSASRQAQPAAPDESKTRADVASTESSIRDSTASDEEAARAKAGADGASALADADVHGARADDAKTRAEKAEKEARDASANSSPDAP